jgi:hypothetical protein
LINIEDVDQNAARGTYAITKMAASSRKTALGPLCKALRRGEVDAHR